MSMTFTRGSGAAPQKPKKNVFGIAQQRGLAVDNSRKGVFTAGKQHELSNAVARISKGAWYQGSKELLNIFNSYHAQITGDMNYAGGLGARFGFLGQLARRLPAPILYDDPEIAAFIFGDNKPTACVDTSGREWMWAPFLEECLQEEARGEMMVTPLNLHEYAHIALNHTHRMHEYPADISNESKDAVINPMVKKLLPAGTVFSRIFREAHGNRQADAKYTGLSEETIARMKLQERKAALEEKGTIRIKNLVIVDGPVRAITTLKAGRDEIKDFDTVAVTVEDKGMVDAIDHVFDCATLEIDNIDNQLRTRKRPSAGGGGGEAGEDAPIMIPVESDSTNDSPGQSDGKPRASATDASNADPSDPNRKSLDEVKSQQSTTSTPQGQQTPGGDGNAKSAAPGKGQGKNDPSAANRAESSQGQSLSGDPTSVLDSLIRSNPLNAPEGHELDINALNDWLKSTGRDELVKTMRLDEFRPEQVATAVDVALDAAEKERLIIGPGYAGGHINDYMMTVVRPNSIYKVHWQRLITELIQGEGPKAVRSLDEYGIYSYVDPVDIGFPADEGVVFEGTVFEKPKERFLFLLDSSGSVWSDMIRMGHFLSFAVGSRATADDLAPDVDIVGADTVVAGQPQMFDDDTILQAIKDGVPLAGGGGTDFVKPINQILAWAAENDIKYRAIVYVTDFECRAPLREELPEEMPPLIWAGMPHDYAKADAFIKQVSSYSDVIMMADNQTFDISSADAKAAETRSLGHTRLSA